MIKNGIDQEETRVPKLEQVGQKFGDGTESPSRIQGITGDRAQMESRPEAEQGAVG